LQFLSTPPIGAGHEKAAEQPARFSRLHKTFPHVSLFEMAMHGELVKERSTDPQVALDTGRQQGAREFLS
jgi:hypothetical protein